jgi:hypothetical protein
MTISDGLSALGLAESGIESQNAALPSSQQATAAIAPALRLRTIGEVKRMIRALLRSLNTSCERLQEIPGENGSRLRCVREIDWLIACFWLPSQEVRHDEASVQRDRPRRVSDV